MKEKIQDDALTKLAKFFCVSTDFLLGLTDIPDRKNYDIQRNVLNRSGYLYDEPHFLLQQEVSEIGSYFSVIRAVAAGNHRLAAISSALEVKATRLTKYLKTLIDLDILEREIPVTADNPEKSKRALYKQG